MKLLRITIVLMAVIIGIHSECGSIPKCRCEYDGDVEVEEQTQSSEVLAGAVGALSSVVVSGGGIGAWYLLKSRSPSGLDSDSLTSEEGATEPKKRPPPPYRGDRARKEEEEDDDETLQETSFKTPNIYTASKNDNLSHRVAASPRNVMTLNDF